jgi:hypothetical protein
MADNPNPGPSPPRPPRYTIDLEALSMRASDTAQKIYSFLLDQLALPKFSLSRACKKCHEWDDNSWSTIGGRENLTRLYSEKPDPPGAENPLQTCSGCAFSYLKPSPNEAVHLTDRPTIESKMRATKRAIRLLEGELDDDPVMQRRWREQFDKLGEEWDQANDYEGRQEPAPGSESTDEP